MELAIQHYEPFFTVIFIVECIFKIFAMGLVINKYGYLRDPWNILDFIIVITG